MIKEHSTKLYHSNKLIETYTSWLRIYIYWFVTLCFWRLKHTSLYALQHFYICISLLKTLRPAGTKIASKVEKTVCFQLDYILYTVHTYKYIWYIEYTYIYLISIKMESLSHKFDACSETKPPLVINICMWFSLHSHRVHMYLCYM